MPTRSEVARKRALAEEARRRALASLETISDAEEAAINAGIAADSDVPELGEAWFATARRGGRPKADTPKEAISIRLDRDVLDHFRAAGPGWQSQINRILRREAFGG